MTLTVGSLYARCSTACVYFTTYRDSFRKFAEYSIVQGIIFRQRLPREIPELEGLMTLIAQASRHTCRGMAKSTVLPQYASSADRLAFATSESALCPGRLGREASHYTGDGVRVPYCDKRDRASRASRTPKRSHSKRGIARLLERSFLSR